MNCTQDCNQGRDFNCLPVTMETEPVFDQIMRCLWTGAAWLGFFSMLAIIAFVWGYKS